MRIAVAWILVPVALTAQQPEVRLDAIGPRPYSVQPGVGLVFPLGYYVRTGVNVGWGPRTTATLHYGEWRGEWLTRVTLDPFRQQRWGVSLGGGLSVRRRTYLAAIVDLEGPAMHGMLPALQFGVSGGVRAGIVLRRAVQGRR